MSRRATIKVFLGALAVFVLLAVAVLVWLRRPPAFPDLPPTAPRFAAGDRSVDGSAIRPYTARYRRETRVLGWRIEQEEVVVTAERRGDSLIGAYHFDSGVTDSIVVDGATLRPIARWFATQRFAFLDTGVTAHVDRASGNIDTIVFGFPMAPFEVSLLDWVIVGLGPAGERGHTLAWDNFRDTAGWLAEVNVRATTEHGAQQVADVRFADGKIRRFWLSNTPPYKVRQQSFDQGRLVQSYWILIEVTEDR